MPFHYITPAVLALPEASLAAPKLWFDKSAMQINMMVLTIDRRCLAGMRLGDASLSRTSFVQKGAHLGSQHRRVADEGEQVPDVVIDHLVQGEPRGGAVAPVRTGLRALCTLLKAHFDTQQDT